MLSLTLTIQSEGVFRTSGHVATRKRPSHELTGIGRFSLLYSESESLREMATSGASLPFVSQRSYLEPLAVP